MQAGSAKTACPRCGTTISSGSLFCPKCASAVDTDATQVISDATVVIETGQSAPPQESDASFNSIAPGHLIGGRYEIIRLLGEGGMGNVYEARDREVDRIVAFKIIRPEMASNPNILRMFKQELVLARQVTHRNVIRIFDLGTADGLRFITMQLVEGRDLKSLLEMKGKVDPKEAASIMAQVCEGLEAAHRENVVHRDLKPQNIMLDDQGRAYVMDFGLAHSTEAGGSEGSLFGTPDYMSPEQVRREEIDARSDLFAIGVIFYELLTGTLPFEAKGLKETLRKRITERVPGPQAKVPAIPKVLNDIVLKCTVPERVGRYQTAGEIVHDLHVFLGIVKLSTSKLWKRTSFAFAMLVLALIGYGTMMLQRRAPISQKPVTMLVADFRNQTGDSVLDGTLEPIFGLEAEGAAFISSYNRTQARQIGRQLQPGATLLDEKLAQLVAVREGLNVVVSGTIARSGTEFVVSAKALDPVTGKKIADSEVKVPSRAKLPGAISSLARPIRKALGDRNTVSAKAEAGETFSAASLEAAHDYSLAQDAQLEARYDVALKYYRSAIDLDPTMGRAYSGMGVIYRNLGELEQAEKNLKTALSHIGKMTERERFRTRGAYYVTVGSFEKAADEYSTLVKQFPADNAGYANLAICFSEMRNLPRAIEEGRKATAIYPRNVAQRNNLAGFLLYSGRYPEAVQEADEVLKLNPSFERAYVLKALAAAASGNVQQAAGLYEQAGKASARGLSYQAIGMADLALYQGRPAEAVTLLEGGIEKDLATKKPEWAAAKYALLASAQLMLGKKPAAAAAAERAIASTRDDGIQFLAARGLIQAGQEQKARPVIQTLSRSLASEPQAYGKLLDGEIALSRGDARGAIKVMQDAQKLLDSWIGRLDLGRAFVAGQAFTEADSEFDACIRRKGEATALFLDVLPTFSYFPPAQYYIGVAQKGIGSPAAAESFQSFLRIKVNADHDPLVTDAKKQGK